MKKALFVATVVKTHIMTFHIPYLKMLQEMGYETAVAARNDYEDPAQCQIPYCDTYFDVPFERSPLKLANFSAYRQLKKIIDEGDYDLIHCHTPVGAMLTRLAARGARKRGTKVLYTAHGFHFYKGAPLINWLVYFPVEWILALWTDMLITMNQEDYARAQKFGAGKVCYVPGVGIDTKKFAPNCVLRAEKRRELGLTDENILVLSVGELNANKNHRVVIEAISQIDDPRVQYIICGKGSLEHELRELLQRFGVSEQVTLAGYRRDVDLYLQAADVFVFPSLREGLPVALMEAMASGLPAVCSRIRGNTDLIEDGVSGFIVDNDPRAVANAIAELVSSPERRKVYVEAARRQVERFDLRSVETVMRGVYIEVEKRAGK